MTARSALTVVGQVVGAYFGPVGSAIGGFIGGAIGGAIDGPVRNSQALIDDLNAIKFDYGSTWPRIYGRYRFKVSPMWTSTKRPVQHDTPVDSKGGPSAINTSYTYEQDWLCWVPLNAIGFSRVWINGELKYSALDESSQETLIASSQTTAWASATFFDGNPTQMPWSIYEASVGVDNAVAFRDRPTLGFESLDLGGSGQPPLVEVEFFTVGTGHLVAGYVGKSKTGTGKSPALPDDETVIAGDGLVLWVMHQNTGAVPAFASGWGSNVTNTADSSDSMGLSVFARLADGTVNDSLMDFTIAGDGQCTWGVIVLHGVDDSRFPSGLIGAGSDFNTAEEAGSGINPGPVTKPGGTQLVVACAVLVAPADGAALTGLPAGYRPFGPPLDPLNPEIQPTGVESVPVFGDYHAQMGLAYAVIDGTTENPGDFADGSGDYVGGGSCAMTLALTYRSSGIVLGYADLADIVMAEETLSWSHEAGALGDDDIDVVELEGIPVTGYGTAGSPRESVQQLMDVFYFGARCSDKLYHPLRGAASIGMVPFADTGVGVGQSVDPFTGLERGNDLEVAVQVAVTGPNLLTDYEPGTENSDRLIGESVQLRQYTTPVVFLPTERKGRADTMVLDGRVASHVAQIALDDRHVEKECFDVWIQIDDEGNSYRVRADSETYADGVRTFSVALDDATILASVGITTEVDERAITIVPPATTELVMIDGPIFRDADNDAGNYAAAKGSAGNWGGAKVFKSSDDISFTAAATILENAVIGEASSALGGWTGGDQFDEMNSVTVGVGRGTLTSSTRSAMLLDDSVNAALIGADDRWEAIRFKTATLMSPGVYLLSGLLRGQRGTEWAMGSHLAGDTFVLIRTAGIRRVTLSNSEVGMLRYYRGVSIGQNGDDVTSQTLTGEAVGLKPFSPVDLRIERQVSSGDNVITWRRRTRLATRFGGPMGDSVPLGEDTEAYTVELYDDDTFTTLVRSLGPVTSATATYSAADQSTDGVSQSDPMFVRVCQVSAVVGNGYALDATA